ncbi:MAG: amino acid ABC transporter permease [Rhodocyclaceae bacterium]
MHFELQFAPILVQWPMLLKGAALTIGLTAIATACGVLLAILFAWARQHGPLAARWAVGTYVELIRNTPFIVQLFFIFFGLPAAGVKLSPLTASAITLVINLSAYATEILRAGIEATPRGQVEAGHSLALTPTQVFLHIVLPPAFKKVWPALVGQITIVMLGSAVCGQISTEELSFATNLIQSRNFRAFEAYIIGTLIYLVLAIALRRLLDWVGTRFLFGR